MVGREELVRSVHPVDVLPAAAGERLEVGREADVVEDRLPVERVGEVAHRLLVGVGRMLMGGEEDGLRHRDADLGRQAVVEELLVGAPPEGVVDHRRSIERGVLQVGAVERDVLRDAVDDHRVSRRLALHELVDPHRLGDDAVDPLGVDAVDQRVGEGVLLAEQDADSSHCVRPLDVRPWRGRWIRMSCRCLARDVSGAGVSEAKSQLDPRLTSHLEPLAAHPEARPEAVWLPKIPQGPCAGGSAAASRSRPPRRGASGAFDSPGAAA